MEEKLDQMLATLEAIRAQGTDWKRGLMMGVLQGVGVIIGSIIALALLGWVLGFLGVIPGFDRFESYLNTVVNDYEHRR